LKATRKEGFSAAVSERALIIREPMVGSLAQRGIKPQWKWVNSGVPDFDEMRMAATGWVGAILYRGARVGISRSPKCSAMASPGAINVNRPHILSVYRPVASAAMAVAVATMTPKIRPFAIVHCAATAQGQFAATYGTDRLWWGRRIGGDFVPVGCLGYFHYLILVWHGYTGAFFFLRSKPTFLNGFTKRSPSRSGIPLV
jgi:hypothetical protein